MATKARQIYTADEETLHKDKRTLEIESGYKTKIDGIEDGAQVNVIEGVKVNGTKLTPDAQKNVNVEVPIVVDNIYTADSEKALSANMGKELSQEIENLKAIGRFLSFWNAVAGKPTSEPPQSPYTYHTGDYFIVDSVATAGGTNYRPEGTTYTTGDASTTVETQAISIGSMYYFDGEDWLLQAGGGGGGGPAQWGQITGTLSNQTDLKGVLDSKITNPASGTAGQVLTKTASGEAWQDVDGLPSQTGKSGKFLTTDGTDASWEDIPEELPSEGTAGQVLTKTASGVAWDDVDGLPDQTGKNGKYLKTNGTSASWEDAGDMKYADFEFSEKAGATLTLGLSSLVKPISNFTINAPTTIKDGQIYILRVENNGIAYSMTLGTNITDPYEVDYTLTDNAIDQFAFLGVDGKLELQPIALQPGDIPEAPVEDVKVDGTSVVTNKVANIDLSGKVDKTTNASRVYGTDGNGAQATYVVSSGVQNNAVVRRNSSGAVVVNTPSADTDAANKKYVDDLIVTKQDILTSDNAGENIAITSGGRGLPSGYTELGWIQSTGTQYIKTGYTMTSDNVEYGISIFGDIGSNVSLFGSETSDTNKYSGVPYRGATGIQAFIGATNYTQVDQVFGSIQKNNYVLKYDGTTLTTILNGYAKTYNVNLTIQKTLPLYLLANNIRGTAEQIAQTQLYSFYIKDNNTLVRDFVPAIRNSDNAIGMYDLITNQFYTKNGTGYFVPGPEVSGTLRISSQNTVYSAGTGISINNNVISSTVTSDVTDVKVDGTSVVDANKVANISLNLSGTVQLASLSSGVYKSSGATYTTGTQSINIDYPHTLYFQYANDDYRYFTIVGHKDEEEDLVASKYLYSIPDDVIDLEKEIYYSDIGDMSYSDFEFSQPTGNTVTLSLSTEIEPSANFTVNAPSTVKEGMAYVLRVTNGATPVTMTLGTGIENPSEVDLTLTANAIDQFSFLGLSDGTLELQPGGSGDSLPDQTGKSGKYLKTDGTNASWENVEALPTLGESGDVLTVTGGIDAWGPMSAGYHVPSNTEWQAVVDAGISLGAWGENDGDNFRIKMKLPFAGYRSYSSSSVINQGSYALYWSSTAYSANYAYYLYAGSSTLDPQNWDRRAYAYSIRAFKNTPAIPDSSWTVITQGTGKAGIYHNATLGLISISSDGTTWYTLQDKNLGATTVYNDGDTLSQANCGNYYQRGNCYGFPYTGTVTTSSTQVDASGYGKGNLYSSNTFITASGDWSSVRNDNLWGTEPIKQAVWQPTTDFMTQEEYDTNHQASWDTDHITRFIYEDGLKSLTELKAMSTYTDVITELNTDAQGYYNKFNKSGNITNIQGIQYLTENGTPVAINNKRYYRSNNAWSYNNNPPA